MVRRSLAAWLLPLSGALAATWACKQTVPEPAYVAQPTSALVEVPYPPPPGRVELIPARPKGDMVWIDGEWTWAGRRWWWRRGRWVEAPPDASYSPWAFVTGGDGTMYIAAGAWRNVRGEAVTDPETPAEASPAHASVVDTEGQVEPTGVTRSAIERTDGKARLDAGAPEAGL